MDELTDHQSLLEAYYSAERSLIWEHEFSIDEAIVRLNDAVKEYAQRNNLNVSFIPIDVSEEV